MKRVCEGRISDERSINKTCSPSHTKIRVNLSSVETCAPSWYIWAFYPAGQNTSSWLWGLSEFSVLCWKQKKPENQLGLFWAWGGPTLIVNPECLFTPVKLAWLIYETQFDLFSVSQKSLYFGNCRATSQHQDFPPSFMHGLSHKTKLGSTVPWSLNSRTVFQLRLKSRKGNQCISVQIEERGLGCRAAPLFAKGYRVDVFHLMALELSISILFFFLNRHLIQTMLSFCFQCFMKKRYLNCVPINRGALWGVLSLCSWISACVATHARLGALHT